MLQAMNNSLVALMDYVLGWLLYVPRDAALIAVAVITSSAMVFPRKWIADQDWLRRCDNDQKRLKQLIREARKRKDKDAVARHKATRSRIQLRAIKYEGKPLLVAVVVLVLVACWCFVRLGFHPPAGGEPVELKLYVPTAQIGKLGHVVPQDGITVADGWVRRAVRDELPAPVGKWEEWTARTARWLTLPEPVPEGVVSWTIVPAARRAPYNLKIVFDGKVYDRQLIVGRKQYAVQLQWHAPPDPLPASEVVMKPRKLFGVVGGFGPMFPPWLVAYLVIALPLVSGLKRVFKIY